MRLILTFMLLIVGVLHAQPNFTGPYKEKIAREVWTEISSLEKIHGIPRGLLHSMSLVETGRGLEGVILPWPYTVGVNPTTKTVTGTANAKNQIAKWQNMGFKKIDVTIKGKTYRKLAPQVAKLKVNGQVGAIKIKAHQYGRRFETPQEATAFAKRQIALGNKNIDVGLLQINWRFHSENFTGIAQAFDPVANAAYAVTYLQKHKETRDWWSSVGRYHSGTPKHANSYIQRVYAMYRKIHRLDTASKTS